MQNPHASSQEEAFEEALSPIVNKLIDKNYETSKDKIASQMAPLIGGAIREQIKSQKDDVVDALYPVMGNMISKYITQALEDLLNKINSQIQDGLSTQTIKRKLKAKLKGVSETELLISEMANSNVEAVLLIHKESGIVLTHIENKELHEPEMLGSMMTAIRSFINDWIEQNEQHQELGEIDYGGSKIILEASGYSYLAVIVKGGAYPSLYEKIRHVMAKIVLDFADEIKNFEGDTSTLPQEQMQKALIPLLNMQEEQETPQKKGKIHPLMWIVPLLVAGGVGYYTFIHYTQTQLQNKLNTKLFQIPQMRLYNIHATVDGDVVTLHGFTPSDYYKELAQQTLLPLPKNTTLHNEIEVINNTLTPHMVEAKILYLTQGLNTQEGVKIVPLFHYPHLIITGEVWSETLHKKVLQEFRNIQGLAKVQDQLTITPPPLKHTLYFKKANTQLTQIAQQKLVEFATTLQTKKLPSPIFINIYSDMKGSQKSNAHLAKLRAKNIQTFLQKVLHLTNTININIKNKPPQGIDPTLTPHLARCATISLIEEDR